MRMISSMFASASSSPSTVCFRRRALFKQKLRAPADDRHPVPQELLQHLLQRAGPRLAVDQRQQNDRKRVLQRRELIKLIEHDFRIGVVLEIDDDVHRLAADRCNR